LWIGAKIVRFVHDTPVKWYKIYQSKYKADMQCNAQEVKEFVKFRKTKKSIF